MKGPRAYTFARAILKAYTNSRYEQIISHLFRNEVPPEPETPMDKVLLSVVDRRLVFMFTRQPLHTMPVSTPYSRLQNHRLKLERLLSNESEFEKASTSFTPMVPQLNKKEWPKPWHWQINLWLEDQQRLFNRKFNFPQKPDTSDLSGSSENRGTTMVHPHSDLVNALTLDILAGSSARPGGSEISGGLCLYSLAVRLARNYISVDPAPEVVNNSAQVHMPSSRLSRVLRGILRYICRPTCPSPMDNSQPPMGMKSLQSRCC